MGQSGSHGSCGNSCGTTTSVQIEERKLRSAENGPDCSEAYAELLAGNSISEAITHKELGGVWSASAELKAKIVVVRTEIQTDCEVRCTVRSPRVDQSLKEATRWQLEMEMLRELLLECGLTEEFKWRLPCYAHHGKNICIIQSMKDFLALMFFKGALLKDPDGVLESQGPHSRAAFRMRFTSAEDVTKTAESIKACVREAVEMERAGLKVEMKSTDVEYPQELIGRLDEDPDFKAAFDELTPGRRRSYAVHFSGAKQSKTRAARIEKYRQKILDGKGFHDR